MLTRVLIILAVVTYLAALGCALTHSTPAPAPRVDLPASVAKGVPFKDKPFRGVVIQIHRVDWMDKYKACIDEIAAMGADTVKIAIDTRQENGSSSRIYLDMRITPTPDSLGDLIRYAKGKGLRVILMPMVLLDKPRGQEWRGQIKPESWDSWWASYRDMITYFAWIAEANHVDVLVVGTELVSTETQADEWRETIRRVRASFTGYLTYSSNWDHYESITWWDALDLIGMNSYWTLGDNENVSVEEIVKNWRPIQERVLQFAASKGKPLIFLEVGWCSQSNAAEEPWQYTLEDTAIDNDLQKRLWEGFFEAWQGTPSLAGFEVWEWGPGDGGAGTDEGPKRGYTPKNKPAQKVIETWMKKPWESGH